MNKCVVCNGNVKKRYDNPPRPPSKYCSAKCKKEDLGASLECEWCGCGYRVSKSRAEISKYCSKGCMDKAQKVYSDECRNCDYCGSSVTITKQNRKSKKVYCNKLCLDLSRKKAVNKNCENCGLNFLSRYKSETGKYSKFCSKGCYSESHNEEVKCDCCGSSYSRYMWVSKSKRSFKVCSKECQIKMLAGKNNVKYNHDNKYSSECSKSVFVRYEGGWRAEHRVLIEGFIGRKLKHNSEPVLHINGDNFDNRLENLYVCIDKSEMGEILKSSNAPYPVSSNLKELKARQAKR